jgi:hypothetical protein
VTYAAGWLGSFARFVPSAQTCGLIRASCESSNAAGPRITVSRGAPVTRRAVDQAYSYDARSVVVTEDRSAHLALTVGDTTGPSPSFIALLLRSVDRGETWTEVLLPADDVIRLERLARSSWVTDR